MPVPDPITRQEQFLNAAATGDTSNLPDPITREEVYLDAIARNGSGGGGTLSGLTDVDLSSPTDGQTLVYDAASSKWVNGSGGGGLPTPTAADVGKVMAVVKTDIESEQVLVPEQTVIVQEGEGADLTGVVSSLVAEDVQCRVVINGEEFTASIDSDWYLEVTYNGNSLFFDFTENSFNASTGGSFTVAVYATVVTSTYSWQPELYAGYDIVVMLDHDITSASLTEASLHLVKGSYADCVASMASKKPISALVYYSYVGESYGTETYFTIIDGKWNYGDFVVLEVHNGSTTKSIYLTESGLSLVHP